MNEIVILAGAGDDLLRKHIELDEFDTAKADAFEKVVGEALDLIAKHPMIGSGYSYSPYRKWNLRGWDLALFYKTLGTRCFIHAMVNMKQDPQVIRAILKSRLHP